MGKGKVIERFRESIIRAGMKIALGSDATGDVYYRNSAGLLTRLGIGSSGQVLGVSGGLPAWQAAPGGAVSSVAGKTGAVTLDIADITSLSASLSGKSDTGHAHSAGDITSGLMATARLGSGTANSSTYLRGDQTWQTIAAGGDYTWVTKSADESVTSSTTLQDDDHLQFSVTANKTYAIEFGLLYTAGSGAIKGCVTIPSVPADPSVFYFPALDGLGTVRYMIAQGSDAANQIGPALGAGSGCVILSRAVITIGSTGGTLKFRWAQQTSNGTATTLRKNSFLAYKQLD